MSHVGPIIFGDETARTQLVSHGSVVTFRTTERTTGETWWRESRLGEKKGDCTVRALREVDAQNPDVLELYADLSGFGSVEAWQEAIMNIHGGLPNGYLYLVTEEDE